MRLRHGIAQLVHAVLVPTLCARIAHGSDDQCKDDCSRRTDHEGDWWQRPFGSLTLHAGNEAPDPDDDPHQKDARHAAVYPACA
eukprot:CAMPEP_0119565626 /NCGR_PEP_ID=MMETSP1352-20130426/30675_1 /TAXON_ID=265584 /ORGANISM="Stauroneis constricta, Strain CCMP1120" /LENGTH=83 /DNA_ID=CAMNT_0007614583 /DNA_START=270 /DNA_END=521 /DNA_ORIENTATION=+